MSRALVVTALIAAVALAGGCPFLPDHDLGDADVGDVFVAFSADFAGYQSWPHVVVGSGPLEGGHDAVADRTVFINAVPGDDDDEFPVGTVIVKEGSGKEAEGGTGTTTHAMVKRGGDFNADGAAGWEFFEIAFHNGVTAIDWRGEQPPDGESYGCVSGDCGTGFGNCNACHGGARTNDFVLSPALELGNFDRSLLAP